MLGRFNLSNVLAAIGALLGLDYALDEILKVLPRLEGPAGRMQRLGGGAQPLVVVDYAHTPDASEKSSRPCVLTPRAGCCACSAAAAIAIAASAR